VAACQSLYTDWPYGEEPGEIPWFSTAAALTRRDYLEKVGDLMTTYSSIGRMLISHGDYIKLDTRFSWYLGLKFFTKFMVHSKKLPSPFTSYLLMRNQLLLLLSYYDVKQLLTLFPLILTARFLSAFSPLIEKLS